MLTVDRTSNGDRSTIKDVFANAVSVIEGLAFACGIGWPLNQVREMLLQGSAGNEVMIGYSGSYLWGFCRLLKFKT